MKYDVSKEEVQEQFPEFYKEAVENLGTENLKFSYDYCTKIEGAMTFDQVIASIGQPKPDPSVDDKVATFVRNSFGKLQAKAGGKKFEADTEMPQCVIEDYREEMEKSEAEGERFDALTQDEQDAEIQDLLDQLDGPGAMVINMGGFNQRDLGEP